MIHRREYNKILNHFPSFELSYEKNFHKKVHNSNIYLTIPKGKKYFIWFHKYKNNNVCFLIGLSRKKDNIETIQIVDCSFDKLLCSGSGTILYGTCFKIKHQSFFNIEDIFFFKGTKIIYYNQFKKINTSINLIKNHINNTIFTSKSIIIGMPIMEKEHSKLIQKIKNLSYEIYYIQHRLLFKNRTFLNERVNIKREIFANFLIKPKIQCDIYDLYLYENNVLINYDIAYIPDYKTSVFMNSLFRKIKENHNLDLLEESDDEDEFENISQDKFVYLDKFYTMKCVFLHKFNKWKPLSITHDPVSKKSNIITKKYN